jgi:tRNA nucleotidyltransferase (CCA-adding enzyme)
VGLLLRLRLSNAQVDETAFRVTAASLPPRDSDDPTVRRWLSRAGPSRLAALARLDLARAAAVRDLGGPDTTADVAASWRLARAVRAVAPPLTVGDLALDGRGLIGLGMKPGPHFGRILDDLLDWVLDDPTRNQRDVMEARALELAGGGAGGGPGG